MIEFFDILVIAGMFVLRIGVPLALVLGIGYLLKRLDRRWAEQAWTEQAKAQPAARAAAAALPGRTGADIPGPQLPFEPSLGRLQPGLAAAPARACWDVKGCNEARWADCPAYQHPDVPCWQARFGTEGHIPETCVGCEIFQRYPFM
jgi:hypothetical protein